MSIPSEPSNTGRSEKSEISTNSSSSSSSTSSSSKSRLFNSIKKTFKKDSSPNMDLLTHTASKGTHKLHNFHYKELIQLEVKQAKSHQFYYDKAKSDLKNLEKAQRSKPHLDLGDQIVRTKEYVKGLEELIKNDITPENLSRPEFLKAMIDKTKAQLQDEEASLKHYHENPKAPLTNFMITEVLPQQIHVSQQKLKWLESLTPSRLENLKARFSEIDNNNG